MHYCVAVTFDACVSSVAAGLEPWNRVAVRAISARNTSVPPCLCHSAFQVKQTFLAFIDRGGGLEPEHQVPVLEVR